MRSHRPAAARWLTIAGLATVLAIGTAACGSSSSSSAGSASSTSGAATGSSTAATTPAATGTYSQIVIGKLTFDMTKYCGSKPFSVGLIDGFGGNAWRVETRALVQKVAKQCSNLKNFMYFDANLDPQKFNATVASWAAQGVNVIVAFDDFGQSVVPAFRQAQASGVKVVTDNAIPGTATIPTDVTAAIEPDFSKGAVDWVNFLTKATSNKGQIVLVGGPPGNLFDGPAITAIQAAIKSTGSGIKLVETAPQYGNWDPAATQKLMSALLAKNPNINGVVLTYMATAPAIIRAYQAAGRPLPAIAGQSSSNETVCQTTALRKTSKTFQLESIDGSGNQAALALAKGVAAYEGISAPELGPTSGPTIQNYAKYIDTTANQIPTCDPSLPAGADLSHALTVAEIKAVLH